MHIMIVDNDVAWTRSLEILLRQRGYQVSAFTDPECACDFICRMSGPGSPTADSQPDAVVLDYLMPKLSGFEVLARIGSHLRNGSVVVFVTGHGDQLQNADFKQLGVAACLEKPVDVDDLASVLEAGVA
jgi:CheY-like chemotaxis protein